MQTPDSRARALEVRRAWREKNKQSLLESSRKYRQRNREKINSPSLKRYHANRERVAAYAAKYREANREAIREKGRLSRKRAWAENVESLRAYARGYYAKNRIRIRIRNRVSRAIRQQGAKKTTTVAGYGIDIEAIAAHLGGCPGNLADWHIDHIKPLSLFDMGDPGQVKRAFSPQNHQWLPANENLRKGNRYDSI